jgi:hypothetical protein
VTVMDASGDLVITLPSQAQVIEQAPVDWQEIGSRRVSVPVAYATDKDGSVGFALGSYDAAAPLTIDPTIVYETSFSSAHLDHGLDTAVDAAGNAYVVAYAYTSDHAVLVATLETDGTLAWSTYLNGSDIVYGGGITVDNAGTVYVVGRTDSEDYPLLNPLQDTLVGFRDTFLSKLSADDGTLLYSTLLGGNYTDQGEDLVLNSAGETVLIGSTRSDDFPVVDPIQGEHNGPLYAYADLFITRISADGQTILYSTYLGGY